MLTKVLGLMIEMKDEQRTKKLKNDEIRGAIVESFLLKKSFDAGEIGENRRDLSIVLNGMNQTRETFFGDPRVKDRSGQPNEKGPDGRRLELFFVDLNPTEKELKS